MELKSVRVQNYRSIEDSGVVPITDITCLVGKNESGKTAFLHALHLLNPLNPIRGKTRFDDVMDFPSRKFSAYRKVRDESPADVVTAVFELTDNELKVIEEDLGPGILRTREVIVVKGYDGRRRYRSAYVVEKAIEHQTSGLEMSAADKQAVRAAGTIGELLEALQAIEEPHPSVAAVIAKLESWHDQSLGVYLVDNYLDEWLPKFFYFSDYSSMRGRVSLPDLKAKESAGLLDEADRTFLSLLRTVDADLGNFDEGDFETLTRELEGAANDITRDAFTYWRQNPGLRVMIQMSPGNPTDEPPLNRGPVVNLRIYNPQHAVTVPFDERSRGFVWFFSFYAYFSNLPTDQQPNTILLLDEPGLSLHATAQGDVLAFIEQKLAPRHQVLYTTHSPFMIDPQRVDRVRTVTDLPDQGTVVSADGYKTDGETMLPLRASLSHELAQAFVTGPNCLLVGWPSDLVYLHVLNQGCRDAGLTTLDPRWVITPVGGADKVATFVSLASSAKLNVAVLIDSSPRDQQRIRALADNGHLRAISMIQISEFAAAAAPTRAATAGGSGGSPTRTSTAGGSGGSPTRTSTAGGSGGSPTRTSTAARDADIEDLLDPATYCAIVSGAYAKDLPHGALKPADLKSRLPRITARVEQYLKDNDIAGGRLDRYLVATYFLRELQTLPSIAPATLDRAAKLFERVNSYLARS